MKVAPADDRTEAHPARNAGRSCSSTTRWPLVLLSEEGLAAIGYEPVDLDDS
jgi:hypothetical protein